MDNVTIKGLVEAVVEKTGLSKKKAREVIDAFIEKTAATLEQGGRVDLPHRGADKLGLGHGKLPGFM